MDKINYQGRQIEATRVNYMSGNLLVAVAGDWSVDHQGTEELFRDEQGEYYLRRQLEIRDVGSSGEQPASGRVHAHRLSLLAAVQWAAMRTNADTTHLRRDVARAFATGAAAWPPRIGEAEVTVPLTLPLDLYQEVLAMGAYDERGDFSDIVAFSLEGDVDAWLEGDDQGRARKRFLAQYRRELEAGLHPHVYPPRRRPATLVDALGWLDAHACKLVGEHLSEQPGTDVRDLLNGAMRFLLEDCDTPGCGWSDAANVVAEARRFRLEEGAPTPLDNRLGQAVEAAASDSILALDPEARTRLDRYLEVTPWDYTAGDLLNGCVVLALDLAFENQAEAERLTGLQSEGFHDGAWGTVERSIYAAQVRREGVENMVRPEPDVSAEAGQARAQAADARREAADQSQEDAPLEIVDLRGTPAAADRPDVALCAAAAVESVDEEEEGEQEADSDYPLRPVLAALATDWQDQAREVRQRALTDPPRLDQESDGKASTTQADSLESCAGALLAALDGKEGK